MFPSPCSLKVEKLADKASVTYVRQSTGLNLYGEKNSYSENAEPSYRKWSETISRTHELWDIALNSTKVAYNNTPKLYGIQDNINNVFVAPWKTLQQTKQAEITRLKNRNFDKLFNPFLRLKE
ncbi:hypothetical protein PCANC_28765 [Puccinia coronata f. sp. avenae]|uniref:Uncharacterized protein n=1 Tax=Puccinia coronata f. sp. avenae TaxID=200324 RepID=A0A2N5TAD5_9BASI|nr:hypothetical protein PCANC_28765 [Puccinia coronata f. sp. avenae]